MSFYLAWKASMNLLWKQVWNQAIFCFRLDWIDGQGLCRASRNSIPTSRLNYNRNNRNNQGRFDNSYIYHNTMVVAKHLRYPKPLLNRTLTKWRWLHFNPQKNISLICSYLNSSHVGDGMFRLRRSISYLPTPWLLKSPEHQQAWYWPCLTGDMYCCSRVDFVNLGEAKAKMRLKMQICVR